MSKLPAIKPREMVAVLKKAGFEEKRQKGSHLHLWHEDKKALVTIPMHPGDLKRRLVKSILEQAGLSEDDFIRLH